MHSNMLQAQFQNSRLNTTKSWKTEGDSGMMSTEDGCQKISCWLPRIDWPQKRQRATVDRWVATSSMVEKRGCTLLLGVGLISQLKGRISRAFTVSLSSDLNFSSHEVELQSSLSERWRWCPWLDPEFVAEDHLQDRSMRHSALTLGQHRYSPAGCSQLETVVGAPRCSNDAACHEAQPKEEKEVDGAAVEGEPMVHCKAPVEEETPVV